jgi:hypothetical protein
VGRLRVNSESDVPEGREAVRRLRVNGEVEFFLTRRHEDTKEGRWRAVSLEDLKVEGGEIDDPTSLVELRRTRLMIFDF